MYITNLEEVIQLLRPRLRDYLVLKLGIRANARKFQCFVHQDNDPSMYFNPKTNDETVKCFSCGWTGDIFACASKIENLPESGPEWLSETIPHLCEQLNIPVKLGEPSIEDKEKARLYKMLQDITDIGLSSEHSENVSEYIKERAWEQEHLNIISVNDDELIAKLVEKGWNANEINRSLLIRTKHSSFFGNNKITFVIKDHRGRPIGFVTRDIATNTTAKYINTPESSVYSKSKTLLGLDIAKAEAKKEGLHIVEGPGDLAQLYRLGITNAAATCGTAFTEQHFSMIKAIGIRKIYLNFDWDNAGFLATQRVLENVLKKTNGLSVYITLPPSESFEDYKDYPKDPDEYLRDKKTPNAYMELTRQTAFEWQLAQASENDSPDIICERMVPSIACVEAAVKREILIQTLSEFTGISHQSISTDVNSIRNNKYNERLEKLKSTAEQYIQVVGEDPDNIMAHIAQHEKAVENVEKEFKRNTLGINYQIARYEAVQELRELNNDDENNSTFAMNHFPQFAKAMSGGMNWASGCLMYVGGRANSGKTATVLSIGCDIALSDPNAIVIIHSTDDSYDQIEPRLKTNLYAMANPEGPVLTIGMVVQPHIYLSPLSDTYHEAYDNANQVFKDLITDEKLIIIDAEDGSTLTVLERNVRYYRQRYPGRKIMLVCDNTHNYMDFTNMDQKTRMTMIANQQKSICAKYHACMIATAEYRKNMPLDHAKLKLPVDDDLADARALMYRPNIIFHVYNDMHDRKEHAEIVWTDEEGKINPRLLLHFTKNKISGFKDKLVLDLNPKTVTLKPKNSGKALKEAEDFRDAKENGRIKIDGAKISYVTASEYTETEISN
tara:strand:- start:2539 stop:5058 length:2520 start_codon:yes stop_codon:yes gene_type:complete